jgi:hypothetical protein
MVSALVNGVEGGIFPRGSSGSLDVPEDRENE